MINRLLKRFNYKKISSLNIKLLLILQNKLTLSFNEDSLTQSKRKTLDNLTFVSQNKLTLLLGKKSLMQNEQEISNNLTLVLQLARVFINSAKVSRL